MLTPVDPKCAVFHFIYLSLHSEINNVTKQSGIKIAVRRLDVFSAKSGRCHFAEVMGYKDTAIFADCQIY